MKKFKALMSTVPTIIAMVAIIALGMAGCDTGTSNSGSGSGDKTTPVLADFNIGTLTFEHDGNPKPVSITAKQSRSQGGITIWYTGTDGTTYAKSQTAPSADGKYAVTFDVAAHGNFEAVTLSAGTLIITLGGEVITDPHYIVDFEKEVWGGSGAGSYGERTVMDKFEWVVSGVTEPSTPDDRDRKVGTRSVRLRGQTGDNCRIELSNYLGGIKAIHFDYASYGTHDSGTIVLYTQVNGGSWEKVGEEIIVNAWDDTGMVTVKFDINKQNVRFKIVRESGLEPSPSFTSVNIDNVIIIVANESDFDVATVAPVADDFNISGLWAIADGTAKTVEITPKAGKSTGAITVLYNGSATAPSAGGNYTVTFNVAVAEGFSAATGLSAGILVIEAITGAHMIIDFEDTEWSANYNTPTEAGWHDFDWQVRGYSTMDANDRYEGTKSIRLRGNSGDECYVELVSFLGDIKSVYFDYASYSNHGANGGSTIVLYSQVKGSSEWEKVDEVTAGTWAADGWKKAKLDINKSDVRFKIVREGNLVGTSSVNVDNIVVIGSTTTSFEIDPVDPVAEDFNITGLEEFYNSEPKAVSITPLSGKSKGTITIYYEGTDGTTYTKSTTAPSAVGKYAVTFDVAAATGFNAATGLVAGTLEIVAITDPHFIVDFEDAVWAGVPYTGKDVTWGKVGNTDLTWRAVGYSTMDANDRRQDTRSLRLRGNNNADQNEQQNRLELTSALPNIKAVSFEYASYSGHSNGTIQVYYKVGAGEWTQAGENITVNSWAADEWKTATININQTGNVCFKIVKLYGTSTSNAGSVNIDNIIVTYTE